MTCVNSDFVSIGLGRGRGGGGAPLRYSSNMCPAGAPLHLPLPCEAKRAPLNWDSGLRAAPRRSLAASRAPAHIMPACSLSMEQRKHPCDVQTCLAILPLCARGSLAWTNGTSLVFVCLPRGHSPDFLPAPLGEITRTTETRSLVKDRKY